MYPGCTDFNPFHIIMIYLRTQTKEWYSNEWSLNLCLHSTFIYFLPNMVVQNFKTERVTKQYNNLSPQKQAKPLTKFYPISILFPISNQAHKLIIFPIPRS